MISLKSSRFLVSCENYESKVFINNGTEYEDVTNKLSEDDKSELIDDLIYAISDLLKNNENANSDDSLYTGKRYYAFDDSGTLLMHLKYWSNACGELHHNGEYDLNDASELPDELQRAYKELWKEGYGCYGYLVEYDGSYYIALVSEFDETFAEDEKLSMDESYEIGKKNALQLYNTDLFRNAVLVIGKETGAQDCHEFIFLVPAMESEDVYDEIERNIYDNIWNVE